MDGVISGKQVKTREPHKCWGCTLPIPIGATVERTISVDGGRIMSIYWCEVCDRFMLGLPSYDMDDGWGYGELAQTDGYPVVAAEVGAC